MDCDDSARSNCNCFLAYTKIDTSLSKNESTHFTFFVTVFLHTMTYTHQNWRWICINYFIFTTCTPHLVLLLIFFSIREFQKVSYTTTLHTTCACCKFKKKKTWISPQRWQYYCKTCSQISFWEWIIILQFHRLDTLRINHSSNSLLIFHF